MLCRNRCGLGPCLCGIDADFCRWGLVVWIVVVLGALAGDVDDDGACDGSSFLGGESG